MKIAHIVAYVSQDGAFGGPLAVARAHVEELARRGHEVHLLAGWDGRAEMNVPGVNVRLFKTHRIGPGFSGLAAPGLMHHLRRTLRTFDIVHVHLGRDLITLRAAHIAMRARVKVVLQTHGMIMPDARLKARVVDFLLTRRVLMRAQSLLALTDAEQSGLLRVCPALKVSIEQIPNGIARSMRRKFLSPNDTPLVLFLARLHPRKGVMSFAHAAKEIISTESNVRFRIIGPDEGDLVNLRKFIEQEGLAENIEYAGPVTPEQSAGELAAADVYVLPSRGEVFPMSVLEAMSVGTPVVLGIDCAIGGELHRRGAVTLTATNPSDIARSVISLLQDSALRDGQVAAANAAIAEWLSMEAVGDVLEKVYK